MTKHKKHLVTSALPYANGALHLGHLAGAYLPADLYVRYLRLLGRDVVWVCGSDEHGAAITIQAKKEGTTPREIIDKYHALNKDTFQRLGISFDIYHRTSEPIHYQTAQDFFSKLYQKGGEFEERVSEQYYDEAYKQFLADRYIIGTCPNCGHTEAFGDQCEKCGTALSPTELINPRSTLSGETPVLRATKHWYFKLDKHADWLREWIDKGTLDGKQHHDANTWKKHVTGQCLSWLNDGEGLQPRSITRDLDWGIPVPLDDAKGKVLYVWFDAPIGYISATKQWALDNGKEWTDYWYGDDVELIHFIGKDNIVFHCIVFPAMLHAHGDFALPRNVPANQFLNFEGQKFSKSRGWGIEQHVYLEEFKDFPNKEDALRWALIRNMPENKDSDFKWDEFVDFHDKELADNFGNFVNRVIVLTHKYFNGLTPQADFDWMDALADAHRLALEVHDDLKAFNFKQAAQTLMELSSWGNTYLQEVSPWNIAKTDPDSPLIRECLFTCLQVVGLLSVLCEPFIPFTAPRVRALLGLPDLQRGDLEKMLDGLQNSQPVVASGHRVGEAQVLFPKIADRRDPARMEIVDRQKAKLEAILQVEAERLKAVAAAEVAKAPAPAAPVADPAAVKPEIQYDDFAKLDLRVATILEAERVPKADKLLQLRVDLGFEQCTIVSGIAEHFDPQNLVGKQVLVVANLAPRKLRGIESQGMILTAENSEGKLGLVSPPEGWENGSGVK